MTTTTPSTYGWCDFSSNSRRCWSHQDCESDKYCYPQGWAKAGCCDFKLSVGKECGNNDDMCASSVCVDNACRRNDGTCDISMTSDNHPDCVKWGGKCESDGKCVGAKVSCECSNVVKVSEQTCGPHGASCSIDGTPGAFQGTWTTASDKHWQIYEKSKLILKKGFSHYDTEHKVTQFWNQFPWKCGSVPHACLWGTSDCPNIHDHNTHVLVKTNVSTCSFATANCTCNIGDS